MITYECDNCHKQQQQLIDTYNVEIGPNGRVWKLELCSKKCFNQVVARISQALDSKTKD